MNRTRIHRATADRLIKELLARVNLVNDSVDYLHRVSEVWVFGSYLSKRTRLGDVDLWIKLDLAVDDEELKAYCTDLADMGFSWNRFDEAREILHVLRNKNSCLHIWVSPLWGEKELLKAAEFKQIFGKKPELSPG